MGNPSSKSILIAGDHNPDYDLYLHSEADNPPPTTPSTSIRVSFGGAGIMERILSAVARPAADGTRPFKVRFASMGPASSSPVAATWLPSPIGVFGRDPKAEVWRARRSVNLGPLNTDLSLPKPQTPDTAFDPTKKEDWAADILVLEDNGGDFRFKLPPAFKEFLQSPPELLPQWIVLKTRGPVCHGDLWWALGGRADVAGRLLVIVPVSDLRRSDIRVSQCISWEHTAEDLARELTRSPSLAQLRCARHVVVTLHSEGALWMERTEEKRQSFRLFFDPEHMEGEWSAKAAKGGEAYGYHSAFAAVMAACCAQAETPHEAVAAGIERGLLAMRAMRVMGHGMIQDAQPGFPTALLAEMLVANDLPKFCGDSKAGVAWDKMGSFANVTVPGGKPDASPWRILETADGAVRGQPLYGKARRVALYGLRQLSHVPHARFGNYFTADRDEIEALRNLKRLIKAYHADKKDTKPLCLAVFGPPGAGKSFGIRQIAESVVEEGDRAFLEFNLSQFSDPNDLIGAFHQVRDKVLEGKLPVVFWDEFDSQNYKWLQFLLAPMQEGKLQEGQITHLIGKCIFVFAGATSYTLENFGPPHEFLPEKSESGEIIGDGNIARKEHREKLADFRLKKGPDFISRLHGHLNVLGPNPRQWFNGTRWEDDPADVCFPVRRAILLRSLLGLLDETTGSRRLRIESGLLAALLETGHYRFGSRSFAKIVGCLKQGLAHGCQRSQLPPDGVLAMNVEDLDRFKELLDESQDFQQLAEQLAPAIHAAWFPLADRENAYRTEFLKLPAELKGDNYAAVARIPHLLGLVGLRLEKCEPGAMTLTTTEKLLNARAEQLLQDHLELLAEEEHDLWMEVRLLNGWRFSETRDDSEKKHPCLIAFAELPPAEQKKDRTSILNLPEVARLAGFKIVARQRPRK